MQHTRVTRKHILYIPV